MANETRQIPLATLRFAADLEMGDNGEGAKSVPIKVKARGAQAVDHWYFGRMVHDLAGMSLSKPRLMLGSFLIVHCERKTVGSRHAGTSGVWTTEVLQMPPSRLWRDVKNS